MADEFDRDQYHALRGEILRAMEDGNHIMSFGLAAIGLVLNAGIAVRSSTLGFFILSVAEPGLAALILSLWFGSAERVARASYFLTGVERRIKRAGTPSWENWLRTAQPGHGRTHHFWSTEYSGIALFLFFVAGPIGLSVASGGRDVTTATKSTVVACMAVGAALYTLTFIGRLHRWRDWLGKEYPNHGP